jgi:uncharacterized protein YndB with AHSA1/START domain
VKWLRRAGLAVLLAMVLAIAGLAVRGRRADAGRTTASIDIDRPPAEVFPWLVDTSKRKQWLPDVADATDLTEGGPRLGARSRLVIVQGSQRTHVDVELTAFEPPRRVAGRITSEAFEQEVVYELEAVGSRTRVHHTGHSTYRAWLARLLEPLFTKAVQKRSEEGLVRLKAVAEAAP